MLESGSVVFWTWWTCTLAVCLAAVARSWSDRRDFLGLPVVACGMWLYFYCYLSYGAITHLSLGPLLDQPSAVWEMGQLLAFVSLLGLLAGWYCGMPGRSRNVRERAVAEYDYGRLWWLGIGCIVIGTVSYYLFLGRDVDSQAVKSAYWYLLFHLMYPGTALCLLALVRTQADPYRRPKIVLLAVLIAIAMFPHVSNARRGPLYPMVIVLLYTYPLLTGRKPRRVPMLVGLSLTGLAMLFFHTARPYIYGTGTWGDVVQNVGVDQVVSQKAQMVEDNEFVYNCLFMATIQATGCYQYGSSYLGLATHWIPRQWWPDKPGEGEGWFPSALERTKEVTGWNLSGGASAGGAAEVFNEFGWLSVAFWFFLGSIAARISRRAWDSGDERWVLAFLGYLCALHWMISQGFVESFVPGAIYQAVPFLAFRFARVRRGRLVRPTARTSHAVGPMPASSARGVRVVS